jgi:hypothetical protein
MSGHFVRPFLTGLGIFAAVYVIEAGLASAAVHGAGTLLYGALLGAFAGFALFTYLRERDASRELRRRRYHENLISHLNHHVRNALQLILNRAQLDIHSDRELGEIEDAVNRIEWTLREILPRVTSRATPHSAGSPFLTPQQPGVPTPRPCPGTYPWYVSRKERLIKNESGPKPAEGDQQVQTSVLRNKSA